MFGLSASHVLILGIVALIFGSKKLPELGTNLGKGIQAFKAAIDGKGIAALNDELLDNIREEKSSKHSNNV